MLFFVALLVFEMKNGITECPSKAAGFFVCAAFAIVCRQRTSIPQYACAQETSTSRGPGQHPVGSGLGPEAKRSILVAGAKISQRFSVRREIRRLCKTLLRRLRIGKLTLFYVLSSNGQMRLKSYMTTHTDPAPVVLFGGARQQIALKCKNSTSHCTKHIRRNRKINGHPNGINYFY